MFRKKHKRLSSVTVELRQIVPSMVIAERKAWYTNVQQQPVTRKKYILDWLKESSKNRGNMTMSNLLKTSFMPTALPSQVAYGKLKKEKMGSFTNCKKYSNITKRCSLCLHEKLAIITYPYPDELLNRRSELVTKCRHENKFLLKNFNSNDWSFEPYDNLRKYNINDIPNGFILLAFSAWVIRQEQNKDIFKLIWRCLCFAFVESFRCWMSARWIYSEYRL